MDFLVLRVRKRAFKTMVKAYLPTIPLSFIEVHFAPLDMRVLFVSATEASPRPGFACAISPRSRVKFSGVIVV